MGSKYRNIINLSGGKDSSALAIYLRDRVPNAEYVFADTKKELPETYEYLDRLEVFLGQPIVRLNSERGFDHWLEIYSGYLPSSRMRWCTRQLKIRPFEEYVGDDQVISYVGLRADEHRVGYIPTKPNVTQVYPFQQDGITLVDVHRILIEAGLGLPEYYSWRSRSGCYFCFFQRKIEWVGLLRHHPDLFDLAKSYEKVDPNTGNRFTWSQSESLDELSKPERVQAIVRQDVLAKKAVRSNQSLLEVLSDLGDDSGDLPCLQCR